MAKGKAVRRRREQREIGWRGPLPLRDHRQIRELKVRQEPPKTTVKESK